MIKPCACRHILHIHKSRKWQTSISTRIFTQQRHRSHTIKKLTSRQQDYQQATACNLQNASQPSNVHFCPHTWSHLRRETACNNAHLSYICSTFNPGVVLDAKDSEKSMHDKSQRATLMKRRLLRTIVSAPIWAITCHSKPLLHAQIMPIVENMDRVLIEHDALQVECH